MTAAAAEGIPSEVRALVADLVERSVAREWAAAERSLTAEAWSVIKSWGMTPDAIRQQVEAARSERVAELAAAVVREEDEQPARKAAWLAAREAHRARAFELGRDLDDPALSALRGEAARLHREWAKHETTRRQLEELVHVGEASRRRKLFDLREAAESAIGFAGQRLAGLREHRRDKGDLVPRQHHEREARAEDDIRQGEAALASHQARLAKFEARCSKALEAALKAARHRAKAAPTT